MECGKKATKQIDFNGKLINVCENHFEEKKKDKEKSIDLGLDWDDD